MGFEKLTLWYPFSKKRFAKLPGPFPQKILQAIFEWHQMRLNFLWGYFEAPTGEEFDLRIKYEAEFGNITKESAIQKYISDIETKSTALLQHISVMIALTLFYLALIEEAILLRVILTFEILGYLWAALACLRCLLQVSSIEHMRDPNIANGFYNTYLIEGMKREVIYRHALQMLVFLTLAFAFTVFLHSALNII